MKKNVLSILQNITRVDKSFNKIKTFIEPGSVKLLGNEPGQYRASSLLSELKNRLDSAERSGIPVVGILELISNLNIMGEDELIINYAFKGNGKTAIIYLDKDQSKLIGAVLI